MSRPPLHALVPVALAALLCACGARSRADDAREADAREAPSGRRPNVVLIVVDTLRADRMSCYGYPRATTPALDAFAESGVRFADVTAQAAWTLPSVASLMTGRYYHASQSEPSAHEPVLAEIFRSAGYRTIAVVGNPLLRGQKTTWSRGFDEFVRLNKDQQKQHGEPGADDPILREAVSALDRLPRKRNRRPLFLWVQPYYPHGPYVRHAEFEGELPVMESVPVVPDDWWSQVLAKLDLPAPGDDPGWERELTRLRQRRGLYDQEVRYTDRFVHRLVETLRARRYYDDTIFAFASDHGEGLWQHEANRGTDEAPVGVDDVFYRRHGQHLYEESTRTPLLLWGRGVPRGVVVEEPVENLDLFPTLLELAGLPASPDVHGASLVGRWEGGASRPFVFSNSRFAASVREVATGLKLTLPNDAAQGHVIELFHLPSDPHERSNLRDARPDDVERLEAVLEGWLSTYALVDVGDIDPEQWEAMEDLGYTEGDVGR